MKKTKLMRRKKTFWGRFRQNIRKRLLSGFLVVVPLGITVFVLNFIYVITAGPLARVMRPVFGELPHFYVALISVALFLALLYLIGLVTNAFIGRKILNTAEAVIQRIPVVKTIYGATKQVVEAVSLNNGNLIYKAAVFVEFPAPGSLSMGFVTGRIIADNGQEYVKVFVPTTPNPTTGFFQLVRPDRVVQSDMNVEDAVKFLMSCGIVAPATLQLTAVGPEPEAGAARPDDEEYDWVEEEVDEDHPEPDTMAS